jgi:hypothetical protein
VKRTKPDIHVTDVRVLTRGYAAACSTCDWLGPEHAEPDAAVIDAKAHESDPRPQRDPNFTLRKIRRRL